MNSPIERLQRRLCRLAISAITLAAGASVALTGSSAHSAATYTVLHTFNAHSDGYNPATTQLLLGADGNYYGVTANGGTNNDGTVFQVTPAGVLTTLHSFTNNTDGYNPQGRLVQDSAGELYGTADNGGTTGYGTVYKLKTNGTGFTTLYTFTRTTTDGAYPFGGLTISGTTLYGTTHNGGTNDQGTVYKITTTGSSDTVLHSFASATDGTTVNYPLLLSGTTLYDVCLSGGVDGQGTLFSMTTGGASFTVLHSFGGSDDNVYGYAPIDIVMNSSGVIYGNSYYGGSSSDGEIWSYNTTSKRMTGLYGFTNTTDGYYPEGYLALNGTTLYGATNYGGTDANGASGLGTIFSIATGNGAETTLHTFLNSGIEGNGADEGLALGTGNILIGMRASGGTTIVGTTFGTIYTYTTSPKKFSILFDFGADGFYDATNPYARPVMGPGGLLYGTSAGRYIGGGGAIYTIGLGGTDYKIQTISDGEIQGPATFDSDGDLFDTTMNGGYYGQGSLFDVPSGGDFMDMFDFGSSAGYDDNAGLTLASDGYYYGTTIYGGQHGYGTIFRYDPIYMQETVLYSFNGVNGEYPYGGVTQASDGNFYGTTYQGGTNNVGTIFKFSTSNFTLTTLESFTGANGEYPYSAPIEINGNLLYGTTYYGGTFNDGVIYSISKTGTGYKPIYSFGKQTGAADGDNAYSGLSYLSNGKIYGTTNYGGSANNGVVFSCTLTGAAYTVVHNFLGAGTDGAQPSGGVTEGTDGNIYGTTVNSGVSPFPGTSLYGTIYEIAQMLPIINSFTPARGVAGTQVTINGANFGTVTGVTINGVAATIVSKSATKVVITVPATATTGPIVVTGTGYTTTSTSDFTITPPTITKFTPTSGAVGVSVTITGTAFVGVSKVTFNGISATHTVVSATSIKATVPTGATTGKIAVTTPGGTATSTTNFTVN